MKGIIDRIEEGVGVVQLEEGGEMLLPADRFPPGSEEGSVLEIIITLDKKATMERREDIRKRQERLK
ncbi:MAG: DUF3006 domain-containing protein [Nitrospirae bacterium]|nr:DUF3006 domain-containing protein [Nitrospirota bacterium]